MLVKDSNVDQFISEPKKEHSKKPRCVRSNIVKMCGDIPRIELFSRDKIEGWDCWGNQIPDSEQRLLKLEKVPEVPA
jgi:N6-adenosine-specific RNA methylase IME4